MKLNYIYSSFSVKQRILIVVPWVLLGSTYLSFIYLVKAFGPGLGYFFGFLFYWLFWCYLLPLWLIGKDGIRSVFNKVKNPFGKPAWLGAFLLLLPPLLAGSTVFLVKINEASWLVIFASLGLALVNATGEELLWRGVYLKLFPENLFLGFLYPVIGFALWHISPQVIHTSSMPGGIYSFVGGALFLGLCFGWVAWKTGSIRWSVYSHILTNFLGLGAVIYFTI